MIGYIILTIIRFLLAYPINAIANSTEKADDTTDDRGVNRDHHPNDFIEVACVPIFMTLSIIAAIRAAICAVVAIGAYRGALLTSRLANKKRFYAGLSITFAAARHIVRIVLAKYTLLTQSDALISLS